MIPLRYCNLRKSVISAEVEVDNKLLDELVSKMISCFISKVISAYKLIK